MTLIDTSGMGRVSVADDVIAGVVSQAVVECYGLVAMASKRLLGGISAKLGEGQARGIYIVRHDDGTITLDLHVVVAYGVRIPEVARTAMERAKIAVENQLGLTVREVNINVHGIKIPE
ncbi:MAG: Asp23/Gls24 family envelope stress response protein [Heliobacteriaceae bacterium]|nr:Asp23/Gls24 family envelope stress response protein [Heliobacteriaceae bacterium]MDD4586995.1 Asp23/Gls24 family envelope stress response protein [Heliobacteriaceae bacterium]